MKAQNDARPTGIAAGATPLSQRPRCESCGLRGGRVGRCGLAHRYAHTYARAYAHTYAHT